MAQILLRHKLKLHYIVAITVCLHMYVWFNKKNSISSCLTKVSPYSFLLTEALPSHNKLSLHMPKKKAELVNIVGRIYLTICNSITCTKLIYLMDCTICRWGLKCNLIEKGAPKPYTNLTIPRWIVLWIRLFLRLLA